MRLRIASYNVHKAVGLDGRRDAARILRVLSEIDADIVVLQEADLRLGARPAAIPRFLIDQETSYEVADLARTDVSLGWHGNAILLRQGLTADHTEHIELPGLEPRGAVMVSVAGMVIVGAHLGLLRRWRLRQMRTIRDHLQGRTGRCLIAGDFNEWSPASGFEPWEADLTCIQPGRSFHAARPVAALDRLAHGRQLHVHDTGVWRSALSRVASDHLPIWADVEPAPSADAP